MDEMESFNYIELRDGPDIYECFALDLDQDYSVCVQFFCFPGLKRDIQIKNNTKYINVKKLAQFLIENCEDGK